ncbi:hypothetical protein [Mesotoga sp.]|uniref:Uncharacterized protein n=1 Tax=Mesotoga infera TaxID=1236046 RepID=A0A117M8U0_9BACT|nr:MAG: Uncharacterized protein XD86_0496 [Mesotoga infera]KUK90670.1 MAG: Uncharacterized protein XE02_0435 [Mesotoga infera]HCO70461.1 hypothetical protein [Mesotoga infera]
MQKRTEKLKKIEKTLAVLSDDVQWKLEDVVLTIGDLIDEDKKVTVDVLREIGSMDSRRKKLFMLYMKASEERDALMKQRIEDLWSVEDDELEEVLKELSELSIDDVKTPKKTPSVD